MKKLATRLPIRQGDVLLLPVTSLPPEVKESPTTGNRIVLAYGEVTGHAHAIYDHIQEPDANSVAMLAGATIAKAQAKARLLVDKTGNRYLEVKEPVTLRHEEHTAHSLLPGYYQLPTQVGYTPAELQIVAD